MLWILSIANAASLPGVALPFDVDANGTWRLPEALSPALQTAGLSPGWALTAVDGQKIDGNILAIERMVAQGPARGVRLHFGTPEGEVIVVIPRTPLIVVEEIGQLPWPTGFSIPAQDWQRSKAGLPLLVDAQQKTWALNVETGAQTPAEGQVGSPEALSELWWSLSDAMWVQVSETAVLSGDKSWAMENFKGATYLDRFQGHSGDFLAQAESSGLNLWSITYPAGTPELPLCTADIPESCLIAGQQVVAQLIDRPGGKTEALRMFSVACEGGAYRACLEAVALQSPELATRAQACGERDVNACHDIAHARMEKETVTPSPFLLGILEYSCAVDASGSLGERLRRLEDVGEGCMLLGEAYDQLGSGDQALLSLDQACVLGRMEACDAVTQRRKEAFALKTVRECEDKKLPLSTACVQLGRLLDEGPIKATTLDSFSAFLRGCKLGDEEGCQRLGDYVDRWGISHPRVMDAEASLLQSCKSGEQHACIGAAYLLVRHEPKSDAYGQALQLFNKACEDGVATACIAGAEQRRIGTARKVEALSPVELWQVACDGDSPVGCAGLGEHLARDKDTWDGAYTAWTKACETGEAGACTDLGQFVLNRHEGPWPQEQAPEAYLKQGCDNGDAEGCYWLASRDIPKKGEPSEATYLLLERGCEGDNGAACAALAQIHLERESNFDDEIAAKHLQQACDYGHFESCKTLSAMYQQGKGVEKDPSKARELAQRYSVNAERRLLRVGLRLGFPSLAGGEGELVLPIPVGPAFSLVGAYSWAPALGGVMTVLKGDSYPDVPSNFQYMDAGIRFYPNNKARGLYGMLAVHQLEAYGGDLVEPLIRQGISGRIGIYNENKAFFTRVEMGIGQYGMINLNDFDDAQTGSFPLIQATLAFSFGLAVF